MNNSQNFLFGCPWDYTENIPWHGNDLAGEGGTLYTYQVMLDYPRKKDKYQRIFRLSFCDIQNNQGRGKVFRKKLWPKYQQKVYKPILQLQSKKPENGGQRGKTCNAACKRGKDVTGAKRGKDVTSAKRGKACNACKRGKDVTGAKRGKDVTGAKRWKTWNARNRGKKWIRSQVREDRKSVV